MIERIPGFSHYLISHTGDVFSEARRVTDKKNVTPPVRKLSTYLAFGYRVVHLNENGITFKRFVHRLVAETFIGPCPNGFQCRHLNGNKLDNNYRNLSWGTRSENQLDRVIHGTDNRGEKHGLTKLKNSDIPKIRSLGKNGNYIKISKKFNVSPSTIGRIVRKEVWKWL